jgi:hypothetical protein
MQKKNCPCCLAYQKNSLINPYALSSDRINVTRVSETFWHEPALCQNCGHIWNTIPPTEKFLRSYYSNQLPFSYESYSVRKRLKLIGSLAKQFSQKTILDYGANAYLSFHSELKKRGWKLSLFDISEKLSSKNVNNKKRFQLITSYFMFEHLVNPEVQFKDFYHKTTSDGFIIIEVPDSRLYHKFQDGLIPDHQQHFQPTSLIALAERCGFNFVMKSNKLCSRNFGFVAIFQKSQQSKHKVTVNKAISIDKAVDKKFKIGRKLQLSTMNHVKIAALKIERQASRDQLVIIWGVNAEYHLLRGEISPSRRIVCVDGDINKKPYLLFKDQWLEKTKLLELLNVGKIQDHSAKDSFIIITALLHYKYILQEIRNSNKKIDVYLFDKFSTAGVAKLK